MENIRKNAANPARAYPDGKTVTSPQPHRKAAKSKSPRLKTAHHSVKKTILHPNKLSASAQGPHSDVIIFCPKCASLPDDQKCIRKFMVHQHPNPQELDGIVITFASEHDKPLPMVLNILIPLWICSDLYYQSSKNKKTKPEKVVKYMSPAELGMHPLEF
jgi:ribosomal protein L33